MGQPGVILSAVITDLVTSGGAVAVSATIVAKGSTALNPPNMSKGLSESFGFGIRVTPTTFTQKSLLILAMLH